MGSGLRVNEVAPMRLVETFATLTRHPSPSSLLLIAGDKAETRPKDTPVDLRTSRGSITVVDKARHCVSDLPVEPGGACEDDASIAATSGLRQLPGMENTQQGCSDVESSTLTRCRQYARTVHVEPIRPLYPRELRYAKLPYQPQLRRIRSSARLLWPATRCACISKDEMNGEMLFGSSGASAPMGVQLSLVSVALSLKAPNDVSQQCRKFCPGHKRMIQDHVGFAIVEALLPSSPIAPYMYSMASGIAMPISPGHTALSLLAPSTMTAEPFARAPLLFQPLATKLRPVSTGTELHSRETKLWLERRREKQAQKFLPARLSLDSQSKPKKGKQMRNKHVRVLGQDTEVRAMLRATKLDMTWLWRMVRDISTRRDGKTASSAIFMHSVDRSNTSGEMRGSWRINLDLVVSCTPARDASAIRRCKWIKDANDLVLVKLTRCAKVDRARSSRSSTSIDNFIDLVTMEQVVIQGN
ncbi:hypothetical protein KCU61_g656, partial [Aureobasidium melanogenum]